MQTRLQYIDRLKGFAILTVVIGHILFYSLSLKGAILQEIIGSFHMPLFMFLSGMMANVPNVRKATAKIITFIMPMMTIGLLFVLFEGSTALSFIQSPYKHSYWYLYVLSAFYVLLYFVQRIRNNLGGAILSVLVWIFLFIVNDNVTKYWNDIFSLWVMKQYWPFFITGYFCTKLHLTEKLCSYNWLYTIGLLLYMIGFWVYMNVYSQLYYLVAFSFIIAILYIFKTREHKSSFVERQLSYIGQHTLDVYIYHLFILQITSFSSVGNWLESTNNIFPELLLCVAYSVLVAYTTIGMGILVKKSDFLNYIIYGRFSKKLLIER